MLCVTNPSLCWLAPLDSGVSRLAYWLSGGEEEVIRECKRHQGWRGKATAFIVLVAVLGFALVHEYVLTLAAFLGSAIGYSIFFLAQGSQEKQAKAGKTFEAIEASNRFASESLLNSFHLAGFHISKLTVRVQTVTLVAYQRLLQGLSGLVHLALSPRLLPIPARTR